MRNIENDARPVGKLLTDWTEPRKPDGQVLRGRYCMLEPLNLTAHSADLYAAYVGHDHVWDYLYCGPFDDLQGYQGWVREMLDDPAHLFYAIRNLETGNFEGVASYLRIAPEVGSIEVGNINFSPSLQRTRAGTEAMYLMMRWVFEAGYRRYEWKCNALNKPSKRSAQRLGFSYEGVFRQAAVVKGRNRDTSWFAAIDGEWPALRTAFEAWLAPDNFDYTGAQKQHLVEFTDQVLVAKDPSLND